MLEFIGFMVTTIILTLCSLWCLIGLWFFLPKYDPIGGNENTLLSKIGVVLALMVVGYFWYILLSNVEIGFT